MFYLKKSNSRLAAVILALILALTAVMPVYAQPTKESSAVSGDELARQLIEERASRFVIDTTRDYVRGQLIVSVRGGKKNINYFEDSNFKGKTLLALGEEGESELVLIRGITDMAAAMEELRANPMIDYAEPNYIMEGPTVIDAGSGSGEDDLNEGLFGTDPDYTDTDYTYRQWGMKGYESINYSGWNTNSGFAGNAVVIAVMDTGVDCEHPDLDDVIYVGDHPDYAGDYGYDAEAAMEGKDATVMNPVTDHGTHVAGIIAAEWNDFGVSGVSGNVEILPVKVSNANGDIPMASILLGYEYLIEMKKDYGCDIAAVNCSFGAPVYTRSLIEAVNEAGKNGILTIVSSGNDGLNIELNEDSSAALSQSPYVIVVDAYGPDGSSVYFSNTGIKSTDIFAPGLSIMSTVQTSNSGYFSVNLKDADSAEDADDEYHLVMTATASDAEYASTSNALYEDFSAEERFNNETYFGDTIAVYADGLEYKNGGISFPAFVEDNGKCSPAELFIKAEEPELESDVIYITLTLDTPYENAYDRYVIRMISSLSSTDDRLCTRRTGWDGTDLTLRLCKKEGYWFDEDGILALNVEPYLVNDSQKNPAISEVVVEKIAFTYDTDHYAEMDGTSMAAPFVTGAVGVVREEYNDEDIKKTAARIIGSTRQVEPSNPSENISEMCATGGYLDLDAALSDANYLPVMQTLTVGESGIGQIEGYFFGSAPILKIDGEQKELLSHSDEIITFDASGLSGEVYCELTGDCGSSSCYMVFKNEDGFESLPLPDDTVEGFYDLLPTEMNSVDGKIYLGGRDINNLNYNLYVWDLENGWKKTELVLSADDGYCSTTCYDGSVYCMAQNPDTLEVSIWKVTGTSASMFMNLDCIGSSEEARDIVYNGSTFMLLTLDENESCFKLRMLDPETFAVTDTAEVDGILSLTDKTAIDEDGNVYFMCSTGVTCSGGAVIYKLPVGENGYPVKNAGGVIDAECVTSSYYEKLGIDYQNNGANICGSADGMVLVGPAICEGYDIASDVYVMDENGNLEPFEYRLSAASVDDPVCCAADGYLYCIYDDSSSPTGISFKRAQINTFNSYGDSIKRYNPNTGDGSSSGRGRVVGHAFPSQINADGRSDVVSGSWQFTAEGYWQLEVNGQLMKDGWVLALNPYGGENKAGWFLFDNNGKMLTGWQQYPNAKGQLKWYYLHPYHDGWFGACWLNSTTPDGYRVNVSGEWIGK